MTDATKCGKCGERLWHVADERWCPVHGRHTEAEATPPIDPWMETARQYARDVDYWRKRASEGESRANLAEQRLVAEGIANPTPEPPKPTWPDCPLGDPPGEQFRWCRLPGAGEGHMRGMIRQFICCGPPPCPVPALWREHLAAPSDSQGIRGPWWYTARAAVEALRPKA